MKNQKIKDILISIKEYLTALYQEQLEAVILYGSQARNEADENSDLDILIILKNNINPYQEIDKTSEFIANLSLQYDIVISRHFISSQKFKQENTPFLYNIRKEGIKI